MRGNVGARVLDARESQREKKIVQGCSLRGKVGAGGSQCKSTRYEKVDCKGARCEDKSVRESSVRVTSLQGCSVRGKVSERERVRCEGTSVQGKVSASYFDARVLGARVLGATKSQ